MLSLIVVLVLSALIGALAGYAGSRRYNWHWFGALLMGASTVILTFLLVWWVGRPILHVALVSSAQQQNDVPFGQLAPTATPLPTETPMPTSTLSVEEAAAAILRPDLIDAVVVATRAALITPTATPCGWQGTCPLATPTTSATSSPTVPPTYTPYPTYTPAATATTGFAATATLTVDIFVIPWGTPPPDDRPICVTGFLPPREGCWDWVPEEGRYVWDPLP